MARVVFPDHLHRFTEGTHELEVDCRSFRQLVRILEEKWPGIESVLTSTTVAIDGQLFQDAWFEQIAPDSEVFFLQRIEGG